MNPGIFLHRLLCALFRAYIDCEACLPLLTKSSHQARYMICTTALLARYGSATFQ